MQDFRGDFVGMLSCPLSNTVYDAEVNHPIDPQSALFVSRELRLSLLPSISCLKLIARHCILQAI